MYFWHAKRGWNKRAPHLRNPAIRGGARRGLSPLSAGVSTPIIRPLLFVVCRRRAQLVLRGRELLGSEGELVIGIDTWARVMSRGPAMEGEGRRGELVRAQWMLGLRSVTAHPSQPANVKKSPSASGLGGIKPA